MPACLYIYLQDNHTPLIYAAQNGHSEVCALLLDHGAHIEAKDRVSPTFILLYSHFRCLLTVCC
jgi:hypothetical protein